MTPEQIDAVTDALIALTDAVDTYGPGLAVGAALWATCRTARRIRTRRGIRRLEHLANHPGAHPANSRKEETP
ncbi:hypothetical protein [Streptomyces griseosporeus]|uniref:hypothetical protein n=1 Tax=Streptomyces griseosporeus TaxID=1910 RepID=UPI0036F7F5A0